MELINWWAPIAWLLVIAALVGGYFWRRGDRSPDRDDSVAVAHSTRLTALPAYARVLRRYRALVGILVVGLVLLVIGGIGLTSRLASVQAVSTDLKNRDIVLCLDVSGSMIDYDTRVVDVFDELAREFTGERISLVVFNASAVTYFPLTSDYEYVSSQFSRIQAEFVSEEQSYYAGTLVGDGSSLVGDGLASCAVRFDAPDTERSRSIILVTDNLVAGKSIFTLPEAGAVAKDRGIRVYGINPGDAAAKDYLGDLAGEFEDVVTDTGGGYYALDDPGTIPTIVEEITAQQAALTRGPTRIERHDEPAIWVITAFLGLAVFFGAAWRLKR